MSDYSSQQLTTGITRALAAGNFPAAVDLLHALAAVDPHKARLILDLFDLVKQEDE